VVVERLRGRAAEDRARSHRLAVHGGGQRELACTRSRCGISTSAGVGSRFLAAPSRAGEKARDADPLRSSRAGRASRSSPRPGRLHPGFTRRGALIDRAGFA
jgi:hypothetical protein